MLYHRLLFRHRFGLFLLVLLVFGGEIGTVVPCRVVFVPETLVELSRQLLGLLFTDVLGGKLGEVLHLSPLGIVFIRNG